MISDTIEGFEIDLEEASTTSFRELINTVSIALVQSITLRAESVYVQQM